MQIGFPNSVLERARLLKGTTETNLDNALSVLSEKREKFEILEIVLAKELLAAQEEKFRWQQECTLLQESRKKATQKVTAFYEAALHCYFKIF